MATPSRTRVVVVTAILTAAISVPIGASFDKHRESPATTAHVAQKYHCPMHPSVVSDHPGVCPICNMKLVAIAPTASHAIASRSEVDGLATVELDSRRQQLIGVRTAVVERGPIGGTLRTVAKVSVDETRVRRINVKVGGYVERVFVDFVGKPVRKGQALFSIYSPEVLAAENDLLTAIKTQSTSLIAASKHKLELWGVPDTELQRLEREGTSAQSVTVNSPINGVVTKKEFVEGSRLEAGAMPYEIVDLSTVWVVADLYERDLRLVTQGLVGHFTLDAAPGSVFSGRVSFVDPVLDAKTRTARVRLSFDNASNELRPEMFGELTLERPAREVVRVPTSAVLRSGSNDVVFLTKQEGVFEPRRLTLGEGNRDFTEVVEGLQPGDVVVDRANFLIDSESQLRASLERMRATLPTEATTRP